MRKTAGLICLIAGGLAWPFGYALEYGVAEILPVHLALIVGGIVLRGSHLFRILKQKRQQ